MTEEILEVLREMFPGVADEVLSRDSYGAVIRDMLDLDLETAKRAKLCDDACKVCTGPEHCALREILGGHLLPVLKIEHSTRGPGFDYLSIRYSRDYLCKFDPFDPETKRLIIKSGLYSSHLSKTFDNYLAISPKHEELKNVVKKTCESGKNLILAGGPGIGKTHLAVAYALSFMQKEKLQAKFESVVDLLFEIRRAIFEERDYFGLIDSYREAPLLILDDFGKERLTDSACEYLYNIMNYRYVSGLQTIITTNALTIEELLRLNPQTAYVINSLLLHLLENGLWVPVEGLSDYRRVKQYED